MNIILSYSEIISVDVDLKSVYKWCKENKIEEKDWQNHFIDYCYDETDEIFLKSDGDIEFIDYELDENDLSFQKQFDRRVKIIKLNE